MADETFRVVLTGGGSGGHVYPLIAVAETLQAKAAAMNFALELSYIGPKDVYAPTFQAHGISVKPIVAGKIRRYLSLANIIDIPKFFIGFVQALVKLYFIMPDVIFSKGGTGAFPVVLAGWFYRIPVAIHESDAQPGLNSLASAYFAKKIFVSFAAAEKYFNPNIVERTGVPVRKELLENRTSKELAKETLGFTSASPLVVVLGGSQGAASLNIFIVKNLPAITDIAQVLHQTGTANFTDVQKLAQAALIDASFKNRYQPVAYFDDLNYQLALTAADLVVARSGSGTLFEIAAFGVPSILVPHEGGGNGHQRANAYDFAETGAAVVIEGQNLLPGIIISQIKAILSNADLSTKMMLAAKAFFLPDAAEQIAQGIMEVSK
jgi:UDP-N-acetylglucosamine--N-acetylmuramyl-(pentapeptide) pyrophosphoryl-undecaprenol N-acetylglucosamine transferase